jgi:hypothetical protein
MPVRWIFELNESDAEKLMAANEYGFIVIVRCGPEIAVPSRITIRDSLTTEEEDRRCPHLSAIQLQ